MKLADMPAYGGAPLAEVNGGVPFFTKRDLERTAFEEYAPLDDLGRCGTAFALVSRDTMPTEPRESIGTIKPSGWQTVRYDWVDGEYLFNRCHLIGYQLTAENANERNLITGTRSLNTLGMLACEDRVADYVNKTGNHVLYRSTPLFEGDDLVARGVLIEALSVEDEGAGLSLCAWCYNVEPGVEIDYATGESRETEEHAALAQEAARAQAEAEAAAAAEAEAAAKAEAEARAQAEAEAQAAAAAAAAAQSNVKTYVLNKNTHKFHYPGCSSVRDMAEHNKWILDATRDEVIGMGYDPCKRCNP